jgi:hypothetical protein
MAQRGKRVDDLGRAYAGSQLQLQIYVNRRPEELTQAVLDALFLASLDVRLHWVSPLESEKFAEYQDATFLRVLGLSGLAAELGKFWPSGGPVWDALAVVALGGHLNRYGALLVEAKSCPNEIRGKGCKAKSKRSLDLIHDALGKTKAWLGIPKQADWTGELYQSANRLAHLYFFLWAGIAAWLVNVYFVGDPHSPTTREEWEDALAQAKAELGLAAAFIPHATEVFLEAKDRRELVGPTDAKAAAG